MLAGFLSPWANYNTAEYKQRLSARSDVSQVSPGAFREVKRGQRVFFVESIAEDASRVGNVFVASMQEGKLGVVMSDTGYQEVTPNGDRFVVLVPAVVAHVELPEVSIVQVPFAPQMT